MTDGYIVSCNIFSNPPYEQSALPNFGFNSIEHQTMYK